MKAAVGANTGFQRNIRKTMAMFAQLLGSLLVFLSICVHLRHLRIYETRRVVTAYTIDPQMEAD
jgi:hypothetical protein